MILFRAISPCPPFSLNNFNITRSAGVSEGAAFFGSLANSMINANFSNAGVRANGALADAALLSNFAKGHHHITLEIDSAKIYGGESVGGVVSELGSNGEYVIVLKIKGWGTIEVDHNAGARVLVWLLVLLIRM